MRSRRLRSGFVVAELSLSLILLAGASLLVVSFNNLMNVPPGFQPAQLVIARVNLPAARYGEHARTVAFFDEVSERLTAVPGLAASARSRPRCRSTARIRGST